MATLIECDRCGARKRVVLPPKRDDCAPREVPFGIIPTRLGTGALPEGWINLSAISRFSSNPLKLDETIEGGDFCGSCAAKLAEWRRPIPRAKPE